MGHAGIFEYYSYRPKGRDMGDYLTYFLHTPVNHGNGTYTAAVELNITGHCQANMMVNHTIVASNHTVNVTVLGTEPDPAQTRLNLWYTVYGGRAMEPLPIFVRPAALLAVVACPCGDERGMRMFVELGG